MVKGSLYLVHAALLRSTCVGSRRTMLTLSEGSKFDFSEPLQRDGWFLEDAYQTRIQDVALIFSSKRRQFSPSDPRCRGQTIQKVLPQSAYLGVKGRQHCVMDIVRRVFCTCCISNAVGSDSLESFPGTIGSAVDAFSFSCHGRDTLPNESASVSLLGYKTKPSATRVYVSRSAIKALGLKDY